MAISLSTFFGGGYDTGSISSINNLPFGQIRVIRVDATAPSPELFLAPSPGDEDLSGVRAPLRRPGFPQYLIINEGSASLEISPWLGNPTIAILPVNRCCFVGLLDDYTWVVSDYKTFQKGSTI